MKIFLISILLSFCVNKSECKFDFSQLNIKKLELNTSAQDFNFRDKSKFKKTIISNEVFIIEFYEKTQVLSSIKDVLYVLRFENNLLEGYTFKIPVDDNEDGVEFFYNMLKKIDKTKNNFIDSEEKLAYMKTTTNCKRFFRFAGSEIFGGIYSKP